MVALRFSLIVYTRPAYGVEPRARRHSNNHRSTPSIPLEIKDDRDSTLASDQCAATSSRLDCPTDADAMDARAAHFHRTGLGFSSWPFSGEDSLTSFLVKIGAALVHCRAPRRQRDLRADNPRHRLITGRGAFDCACSLVFRAYAQLIYC